MTQVRMLLFERLVELIVHLIAFKASDFSIINTDGNSDFDIEKRLTLEDAWGRKLNLKLSYMWVYSFFCQMILMQLSCLPSRPPDSGGAFKVQIYSPYVIVNKTGLPFSVKSVRSNRAGPPHDVAGETQSGKRWADFWELEPN